MSELLTSVINAFQSWGWIAVVGIYVICAVSRFFLLQKAGESGWKGLIPGYGLMMEFRVMYTEDMMFGWLLTGGLLGIIAACMVDPQKLTTVQILLLLAAIVLTVIFFLLKNLSGARRYKMPAAFGVGMLVLPFVFYPILAVLSKEYDKNL